MTDQRLQALSRAARLDPSREPELLRERVRAGTLAPEKLELAAYCGSEVGREALSLLGLSATSEPCSAVGCGKPLRAHPIREGRCSGLAATWCPDCGDCTCRDERGEALAGLNDPTCPLHAPWSPHAGPGQRMNTLCVGHPDLAGWISGLSRWGAEVQVRAAVAAGWGAQLRACLDHWEGLDACEICEENPPEQAEDLCPVLGPTRRALEAAEAWLACPCERHLWGLVTRCQQETRPDDWLWWLGCVFESIRADQDPSSQVRVMADLAARQATSKAVRTAISKHLTSWALGGQATK